jgi:hypothetical protein
MINNWISEGGFPGYIPITIPANEEWHDTGITFAEGEMVSIDYLSGKWMSDPAFGFVDAGGYSNHKAPNYCPLPDAPQGALCGRVGEKGDVFPVGKKWCAPVLKGELYLFINDGLGNYGDNKGAVTVAVSKK